MLKKHKVITVLLLALLLSSSVAEAKISKEFKDAFEKVFTPAVPHKGLITAASPLELSKLRTYVVVEVGGVLTASRAFYMISPGEYDYRGNVIKGDSVKTRGGEVYAYLPKGTVMAVAGDVYSGRNVYVKLISLEKINSIKHPQKHSTKVTMMIGFKFDKATLAGSDLSTILPVIEQWIKPFSTLEEAKAYSQKMLAPPPSK